MKDRTAMMDRLARLHFDRCYAVVREELIRLCREVMQEHKAIKECCIAMGTCAFYTKQGPMDDDDERLAPVFEFLDKWNGSLYLTGDPARFKATGEIRTDW